MWRTYGLCVVQEEVAHALGVERKEFRVEENVAGVVELEGTLQVMFCANICALVSPHGRKARCTHRGILRRRI